MIYLCCKAYFLRYDQVLDLYFFSTRRSSDLTLIDFLKERYKSHTVDILSAFSIIIFLFSAMAAQWVGGAYLIDRKSTRLNSSHVAISYAVFFLYKKKKKLFMDTVIDYLTQLE